MAYTKTVWNNDAAPYIDATNLNNIEDGIESVANDVDGLRVWSTMNTSDDGAVLNGPAENFFCDTSGGAFIVNLPATPAFGTRRKLVDVAGTFGTNNLTVGANGSKIIGDAEDLVLDVALASVELVYSGDTYGWVVTTKA